MSYKTKGLISILLLYGCGNNEEKNQSYEARLTAVEQQITLLTQRYDREEHLFQRNLSLLHGYSMQTEESGQEEMTLEEEIKATKGNFLSWSKKTLDGLSDFLIDNP
jgi:hypothetical protein